MRSVNLLIDDLDLEVVEYNRYGKGAWSLLPLFSSFFFFSFFLCMCGGGGGAVRAVKRPWAELRAPWCARVVSSRGGATAGCAAHYVASCPCVAWDHWPAGFMKTCNVSPDAFIQMAMQLAYFRDIGKFHATCTSRCVHVQVAGSAARGRGRCRVCAHCKCSLWRSCTNQRCVRPLPTHPHLHHHSSTAYVCV